MDNLAFILIGLTNLMLVIILGVLAFLVYRLLKQNSENKNSAQDPTKYHPAILERMKEAEKLKPKRSDLFCPNHPDEPGEVMCAICDKIYCKACIRPFKSLHFCKEHIPLVMRHDWEEVLTLKTSTNDPEEGVRLYEAKKNLFENENIPTYIETHYKINVDHDYIETYLVLFAIKEQVEIVKPKLELH